MFVIVDEKREKVKLNKQNAGKPRRQYELTSVMVRVASLFQSSG